MRDFTAGAYAGVAEAVDARVSKTRSFGSVSSSLTARTSRLTVAGANPTQQSRVLLRSQSEIVPAYSFHSRVLSLT